MPFYQGGGRRALPSMAYARPDAVQMGLLSDELWPVPQFVSTGGRFAGRRRSSPRADSLDAGVDNQPTDTNDDELAGLPASVINLYRERLDQEGQDYLAHGPRTFEEQLAYAQWVRPNAHENSRRAAVEDQLRFRQQRDVDWANNFVGPDGIVYVRDHWMGEEKPEARIFRAYEKMVGGFKRPKIEDLLGEFDLPDPLEGIGPETKAKLAEVEPPISADEAAWRAWAREQKVNPATWFKGEKLPDSDQRAYWFGETRDVPPVAAGMTFVGPDGFIYEQNDLTREGRATQVSRALEEKWAREALRDAPLSFQEAYDRALAAGAVFPGTNLGRGYVPATRIFGQNSVAGLPGHTWQTPIVQEILRALKRWGRLGNPKTRALNARLARAGENALWKHAGGATNAQGEKVPETYVPSPLGDFGLDGRRKSHFVDVTHEGPDGKMTWTQSMTRDPKTGKGTLEEQDILLELFKRLGGAVIGVVKDP